MPYSSRGVCPVSSTHGIRSLRLRPNRLLHLGAAGAFCLGASLASTAQDATATPTLQAPAQVEPETSWGTTATEPSRRDVLLGLAQWDHTLLGAFELGARLLHLETSLPQMPAPTSAAHPVDAIGRFRTNGGHVTINDLAHAWKMDQLQRTGMNMDIKSPYGAFRLTYREIFNGRATNALGGGIGQASAAAMYSTPRFGAGNLWDFSAAALMGNGSINQLMGGGFGNNSIGGFGPHLHKADGPTVAIKLTF
jgi:hypothetical protein